MAFGINGLNMKKPSTDSLSVQFIKIDENYHCHGRN
jgi:hypothetical protein